MSYMNVEHVYTNTAAFVADSNAARMSGYPIEGQYGQYPELYRPNGCLRAALQENTERSAIHRWVFNYLASLNFTSPEYIGSVLYVAELGTYGHQPTEMADNVRMMLMVYMIMMYPEVANLDPSAADGIYKYASTDTQACECLSAIIAKYGGTNLSINIPPQYQNRGSVGNIGININDMAPQQQNGITAIDHSRTPTQVPTQAPVPQIVPEMNLPPVDAAQAPNVERGWRCALGQNELGRIAYPTSAFTVNINRRGLRSIPGGVEQVIAVPSIDFISAAGDRCDAATIERMTNPSHDVLLMDKNMILCVYENITDDTDFELLAVPAKSLLNNSSGTTISGDDLMLSEKDHVLIIPTVEQANVDTSVTKAIGAIYSNVEDETVDTEIVECDISPMLVNSYGTDLYHNILRASHPDVIVELKYSKYDVMFMNAIAIEDYAMCADGGGLNGMKALDTVKYRNINERLCDYVKNTTKLVFGDPLNLDDYLDDVDDIMNMLGDGLDTVSHMAVSRNAEAFLKGKHFPYGFVPDDKVGDVLDTLNIPRTAGTAKETDVESTLIDLTKLCVIFEEKITEVLLPFDLDELGLSFGIYHDPGIVAVGSYEVFQRFAREFGNNAILTFKDDSRFRLMHSSESKQTVYLVAV